MSAGSSPRSPHSFCCLRPRARTRRPQPLTDRSDSVCLFSCRHCENGRRSAAPEYGLVLGPQLGARLGA